MLTIRQLNTRLRDCYEGARDIRHYQAIRGQYTATMLTTDQMPNTNESGRIFAGYTDELRQEL